MEFERKIGFLWTYDRLKYRNGRGENPYNFELDFANAPIGIEIGIDELYVVEVNNGDEWINFLILDDPFLDLEMLAEAGFDRVEKIKYLTKEEVLKEDFYFVLNDDDGNSIDNSVPYNRLYDWILARAKEVREYPFWVID